MPIFHSTEESFDAEYDLSTLKRADEIRKNPKRFSAAMSEAQKQMKAVKELKGFIKDPDESGFRRLGG